MIGSKIKALVGRGRYIEALQLYAKTNNHLAPSKYNFPSLLKACASLSLLRHGQTFHSSLITTGLSYDPYITSSLINLYVKCGSLRDAVNVFDKLSDPVSEAEASTRDVTVWNSIIDGFFRFGHIREATLEFRLMQSLGIRPDAYSLCILLGESDGNFRYAQGTQIHGYIVRNSFSGDLFLGIALINMYFGCGRPLDAWHLFVKLDDKKDIVAWNVMIRGFGDNGLWEDSLEMYLLAKIEDVKLRSVSFTCVLGSCCQGEFANFGQQVHSDVIKMGFEYDPYVRNSLLTMYAKCKLVEHSEKVFDQVLHKEIELWNAMISAYTVNGQFYDALKIYKQMKLCEILPDAFTISNILSSSTMAGLYDFGRSIHTDLVKRPMHSNITVHSALLTMYSKCRSTDDAKLVFTTAKERDVVAWGSLISGFCQNREYKEALEFFEAMKADGVEPDSNIMVTVITACTGLKNIDLGSRMHGFVIKGGLILDHFVASSLIDMYSKCGFPNLSGNVFSGMPHKNLVAWNCLISCYCHNGLPELSINLFPQIMQHRFYPDVVTITSVLVAISSVAALLKGKAVHGYLVRLRTPSDLQLENKLIDMYLKCGCLKYAQCIFQNMPQKDLVTWNSMIAGYGSHGDYLKAMGLFNEMEYCGVTPDDLTLLSLLSSCNHSGLIEEGLNLFQLMRLTYGIEPTMEHYVNIVDLLGRAGRLNDAHTFVKNMPIEPDRSIWLSLMCSCRAHNNIELGEVAASKLLEIEPGRGSNYVQFSNLYGEAGLWDRTASLWMSMKEKGLKKHPGCSWIEVRNRLDVFFSGGCSSERTKEIHDTLSCLRRNMVKTESRYFTVEDF